MTDRLYHEIMCPALTKMGPCSCQPVIVGDEVCGHGWHFGGRCEPPPAAAAVDPHASSTGKLSTREKEH